VISEIVDRRLIAALLAVAALVAAGCGGDDGEDEEGQAAQGDLSGTVEFWWWGEEEAPGFEKWIKTTTAAFEDENPKVKVKLVEQTTDNIVQAAQAAQAAQEGPDLQFYWPVGWFQEDMFNGGLAPLDDLLGEEEIAHYPEAARDYVTWEGKVHAAPMYSVGNPWFYRKDLFAKAGLDPESPPETFDELLAAGRKLKAAGITPIAAGMKDQWYADWPWLFFQACGIESADGWFDGFLGRTSLADPAFTQTWEKIAASRELYGDDLFDVTLYEGFDKLLNGEAAIATPIAPAAIQWERDLGGDKLGTFLTPCQDESPLAGKYPDAYQLVAIPTFSDQKEEAAAFIKFMHQPEHAASLYEEAGAILGDDRLSVEPDGPVSKQILDWSRNQSYFALYYTAPPAVDEWIWPIVADLLRGSMTPAEAGQKAQETNQRWLDANKRLADNFAQWQKQVTAASQ
jgi:raffinose/stachyose/melibiose transport system substrate-binding protein